jgi:hypothetical protein
MKNKLVPPPATKAIAVPLLVVMTDRDTGRRERIEMTAGDVRCRRIAKAYGIDDSGVMAQLESGSILSTFGFYYQKRKEIVT